MIPDPQHGWQSKAFCSSAEIGLLSSTGKQSTLWEWVMWESLSSICVPFCNRVWVRMSDVRVTLVYLSTLSHRSVSVRMSGVRVTLLHQSLSENEWCESHPFTPECEWEWVMWESLSSLCLPFHTKVLVWEWEVGGGRYPPPPLPLYKFVHASHSCRVNMSLSTPSNFWL